MNEADSDYEETEYLIFADFKNRLPPHQFKHTEAAIKIIGIDSNPVAEINGHIFKGTYDMAMGTNLFFKKDTTNVPGDPLFETTCRQKYKYFDKSNKVINFERVYIEKLRQDPENIMKMENDSAADSDSPTLKVKIKYNDAIKKFCEED